jgi:AcrR family transcriptional regulator
VARIPADVRREQFIEAAMTVIVEHGVEGATTRRIAEAAGAPLASLHYCFRSKEELFVAIWEKQLRGMRAGDSRSSDRTPRGLGPTAADELRIVVDWITTNEMFAVATIDMLFWAKRHDPELAKHSFQIHIDSTVGWLQQHLLPGDDPSLIVPLADMIAAAVDGLSLQWVTFHDRKRLQADVDLWAQAIERLVESRALPVGARAKRAAAPRRRSS